MSIDGCRFWFFRPWTADQQFTWMRWLSNTGSLSNCCVSTYYMYMCACASSVQCSYWERERERERERWLVSDWSSINSCTVPQVAPTIAILSTFPWGQALSTIHSTPRSSPVFPTSLPPPPHRPKLLLTTSNSPTSQHCQRPSEFSYLRDKEPLWVLSVQDYKRSSIGCTCTCTYTYIIFNHPSVECEWTAVRDTWTHAPPHTCTSIVI